MDYGTRKVYPGKTFGKSYFKIPSAVVTGRPRKEAEYFLKLHGLDSWVKTLVCMEDTPNPKPDLTRFEST